MALFAPEGRPRGCHSSVTLRMTFHTWTGGMFTLAPCDCGRALASGLGFGTVTLDQDPAAEARPA